MNYNFPTTLDILMTNILAIHAMTLISLNVVVNFTTEVETHLISTKYIKWTPLIDYNKT